MRIIYFVLLNLLILCLHAPVAFCSEVYPSQSLLHVSAQINTESVGGWLLNDTLMISSYRSNGKYRLQLEKITGRDANGIPIPLVLDTMSFSLYKTDYISRGSGYCHLTSGGKDPNLVVLINRGGIYKAWTIHALKFKPVSITKIKCILGEEDI